VRNAIDRVSRPSLRGLVLIAALLLIGDQALRFAKDGSLLAALPDETAHLMTGALLLAALPQARERAFTVGVLAGSVLIDADHLPGRLGIDAFTQGTDRPYSHSLLTLALLLILALVWRARRPMSLGLFVGVAAHFARDLTESSAGVPLLWPWSYHSYRLPHASYLVGTAVLGAVALWRLRSGVRRGPRRPPPAIRRAGATGLPLSCRPAPPARQRRHGSRGRPARGTPGASPRTGRGGDAAARE
jgi:membrane-bound metal-dependent hydrolase YbcI (DUF457 family)